MIALLVGCNQLSWCGGGGQNAPPTPPPPSACPDDSVVTWDNFAGPLVATWCTPCHSNTVAGEARSGAPEGVDFDTYDDVVANAELVRAYAAGINTLMPPAGGLSTEERQLLEEWIVCGMPSPPTVAPDGCDVVALSTGDVTIQSAGDNASFCQSYNGIDGNLIVGGGDVSDLGCLCEVTGDLVLDGSGATTLELPELRAVGGSVVLADSDALTLVDLVSLETIGGELRVEDNAAVVEIDLYNLSSVGGDVLFEHNDALAVVGLPFVYDVAGDLVVQHNPSAVDVILERVEVVNGELTVLDNPAMATLSGAGALVQVDGAITIGQNDELLHIEGFGRLVEVDGSVDIYENDELRTLNGFHQVEVIHGYLVIRDNPALGALRGFPDIVEVKEHVIVSGNATLELVETFLFLESVGANGGDEGGVLRFSGNPAMPAMMPFPELTYAGGLDLSDNDGLVYIGAIGGLLTVDGEVTLSDNDNLEALDTLAVLESIGSHLSVESNPSLVDLGGFDALGSVGGDLVVRYNTALGSAAAEAFGESIGVENIDGAVLISNNGP